MKKYEMVDNFVIKLRAYPNKEQAEKIDAILNGLRVAYNVTAYEISNGNPLLTHPGKKDETVLWPDFPKCMKKDWLNCLRENHEVVKCVPATSLSSSVYGVFKDMEKSYKNFHPEIVGKQAKTKTGKPKTHKDGTPVWEKSKNAVELPVGKWKPEYYSKKKPRRLFAVQTNCSKFIFKKNSKTVYIGITNIGLVKTRGWRFDIRFGDTPEQTFEEFYKNSDKAFGVTVSKDNCGDYWICVKLQTVWKPTKEKEIHVPIGIDAGIKDIAITSEGVKYPNYKFARQEKKHKRRLNRKLSRRQGWANIEFREAHDKNKELKPSKRYERTKIKLAKLERKIARRRENWNHFASIDIVSGAEFIGIESLNVKGMMKNKHLAYSLTDAAMYDFLNKVSYKANWAKVPIQKIGTWEPSSQTCHICGYVNKAVKSLNVRDWTCPECGTYHDRDVNAAINILNWAKDVTEGKVKPFADKSGEEENKKEERKSKKKTKNNN